jgi:hypothetical protein
MSMQLLLTAQPAGQVLGRTEFVEWYVSCALIVVGGSLLLRARAWINALSAIARHPATPIISGLYATLMGLFVVLSHNIWVSDLRIIVTLIGWIALGSGVVLLMVPEAYSALLRKVPISPGFIALRGLIRLLLGGAVLSYLLTQG